MASPRSLLAVVAAPLLLAAACSSDSSDRAEPTTSAPVSTSTSDVAETTLLPTTSSTADASASTSQPEDGSNGSITVAVYWTRPYGQARPVDVPGYRDEPNGPFPFVLYGSATNTGEVALDQPQVDVTWSVDGEVVHRTVADLRAPEGGTLAALEPGAAADLIVVVEDESVAAQLSAAVPAFGLHS